MDLSAPAYTIPGGKIGPFDTRNMAFGKDIFPALFLFPESEDGMTEKEQYYIRSLLANALLRYSAGSAKFSVAEISTVTSNDITDRGSVTPKFLQFLSQWQCSEYTILKCFKALGGALLQNKLINVRQLELIDLWLDDLRMIDFEDIPVVDSNQAAQEPCIGADSLDGVYFHPSVRLREYEHRSRQGKVLAEDFASQLKKSEVFASRMLTRLCPSVDLKSALDNYNNYDPHDNILLIVTFYEKNYTNIPLLEIMYRHHFKNILYCGEADQVVDEYMNHYNGKSGTYFSFLPVHHKQSAGYECLLGAIEMGYHVDGFLLVNEDTLVNSWNFGEKDGLDPTTVWHGNEHAINVTIDNLETLETDSQEIMKSMLGILHAFQFLENVLLSEHPDVSTSPNLLPPPPLPASRTKRNTQESNQDESEEDDYSAEEMIMMHEDDHQHSEHDHEMSIVDDHDHSNAKEHHISLFGEIVHDDPEQDKLDNKSVLDSESKSDEAPNVNVSASHQEVSELLFHPANFRSSSELDLEEEANQYMKEVRF